MKKRNPKTGLFESTGVWLKCETCGKEIYRPQWRIKRSKHFFCSVSCEGRFRKGKLSGNWKGGIKRIYDLIRNLEEYNIWRSQIFKRDNYTCLECGNYGEKIHAHHINIKYGHLIKQFLQEYNQFSPIEDKETLVRLAMNWKPFWNIDNGITLCEECHKKEHTNLNFTKKKEK